MNDHGEKSRKLLTSGIGLVLVAIIAVAVFMYRADQQQQAVDSVALLDIGIEQFRTEQYEQSLQTLASIPEGSVEDWHLPYYMGSAEIKLKDYASAATHLEEALALNNGEQNTLFALGVVYYKLGNLSMSKAYFASVLEINPGHEEAKGLMDIMASLERQQPGAVNEDTTHDSTGDDDH
jgi:tetratricopeptide (TPR) repeat protein